MNVPEGMMLRCRGCDVQHFWRLLDLDGMKPEGKCGKITWLVMTRVMTPDSIQRFSRREQESSAVQQAKSVNPTEVQLNMDLATLPNYNPQHIYISDRAKTKLLKFTRTSRN